MKYARAALSLMALVALVRCGEPASEHYVAFERDFSDFRSWPRVAVGSAPLVGHSEGQRYVYRRPTPAMQGDGGAGDGGLAFATGTVLVKAVESGAADTWRVFAMVKRGGEYNRDGARGWEFFELKIDAAGRVSILARGVRPGVAYDAVNEVELTCNDCHRAAAGTDSVLSGAVLP
jgi:hypothetical protein